MLSALISIPAGIYLNYIIIREYYRFELLCYHCSATSSDYLAKNQIVLI